MPLSGLITKLAEISYEKQVIAMKRSNRLDILDVIHYISFLLAGRYHVCKFG